MLPEEQEGTRRRRKVADDAGREASVAALLNLARDSLSISGVETEQLRRRNEPLKRVLAGLQRGLLHLIYYL